MKIRAAVEAAKESGVLVLARTDCRPSLGIDEAVARIEMYVEEDVDILFLDSPADWDEMERATAAAAGRPSFIVLSPGSERAPTREEAAQLGFKIGTYPAATLSPVVGAIAQGLSAIEGEDASAAPTSVPPRDLFQTLAYSEYEATASRFVVEEDEK